MLSCRLPAFRTFFAYKYFLPTLLFVLPDIFFRSYCGEVLSRSAVNAQVGANAGFAAGDDGAEGQSPAVSGWAEGGAA